MTPEELKAIYDMRAKGYAIVVKVPMELQGVKAWVVEEEMREVAYMTINNHKEL